MTESSNFLPTSARLLTILTVLLCSGVSAHHSPAPFDLARTVEIEGSVTRFLWRNPHVYVDVETVGPDGQTVIYSVEASWPASLLDHGWSRDTLKPGDRVTVFGNPARDPRNPEILGRTIAVEGMPEPLALYDFPGVATPFAVTESAERRGMPPEAALIGTWQPIENFDIVALFSSAPPLTESGRAAVTRMQAANEGERRAAECLPHSPPFNTLFQEAKAFERRDGVLVLRLAVDGDVERLIRMPDAELPADPKDRQGISRGRWDNDTLVVTTTFDEFEDSAILNIVGVPGTGTLLTERFALNEDRNRLTYSYRVENPGFLTQALTGSVTWALREDLEIPRLDCDPEIARRFLGAATR